MQIPYFLIDSNLNLLRIFTLYLLLIIFTLHTVYTVQVIYTNINRSAKV